MNESNAIIIVIGDNGAAEKVGKTICDLIYQVQETSDTPVMCAAIGVKDMRSYAKDPDAPMQILEIVQRLPDIIRQTNRKLVVAFDTEGCDFLDELDKTAQETPEALQKMQDTKISIISMAGLMYHYCKAHGATKIWIQDPIISGFDDKLAERLKQCEGVELYRLTKTTNMMANIHAVRAMSLYDLDGDGKDAAGRFWNTVHDEFNENGVQAALVGQGMSVLVEQGDKSMMPAETIDTQLLYMQSILTWVNGDY